MSERAAEIGMWICIVVAVVVVLIGSIQEYSDDSDMRMACDLGCKAYEHKIIDRECFCRDISGAWMPLQVMDEL